MSVQTREQAFGQRVRELRLSNGLRQTDLAERAGLSWRHLLRIEKGEGGVTKAATVARLAAALGITPAELDPSSDDDEEESLPRRSLVEDLHRLTELARLLELRPDLVDDIRAEETVS